MARPKAIANLSLADLEKMLSSRRSELGKLGKQRDQLRKKLAAVEERIAQLGGGAVTVNKAGRARNERSLGDVMADVLSKAGGPLAVGEIMEGVLASGYRSNAANFRAILNQTLIKDKRFAAKDRGVYQLKK